MLDGGDVNSIARNLIPLILVLVVGGAARAERDPLDQVIANHLRAPGPFGDALRALDRCVAKATLDGRIKEWGILGIAAPTAPCGQPATALYHECMKSKDDKKSCEVVVITASGYAQKNAAKRGGIASNERKATKDPRARTMSEKKPLPDRMLDQSEEQTKQLLAARDALLAAVDGNCRDNKFQGSVESYTNYIESIDKIDSLFQLFVQMAKASQDVGMRDAAGFLRNAKTIAKNAVEARVLTAAFAEKRNCLDIAKDQYSKISSYPSEWFGNEIAVSTKRLELINIKQRYR